MATPTWVAEKATGYLRGSGYKAGTLFGIVPKNNITSNFNPDGSWLSWKAPYIPNGFDFTFTRNSVANRINSAGLLEEMAIDVPRIQYPTCPSVLMEVAVTNYATYSEDLTNWLFIAAVDGSAPVITANQFISPDGTQNADNAFLNLNANGAGSRSGIKLAISGLSATEHQGFFWFKAGTPEDVGKEIRIRYEGMDTAVHVVLTDQWQLYETSGTTAASINLVIELRQGFTTAITCNVSVWGAQLEEGSYPTSYIKTGGATATRAIDAAIVSNLITNGILSATEGTVQDKRDAISYVSRYTSDGDKEDFVNGVSQGVPAPGAVPSSFSLTVPSLTNQVPMYPTPLTNDEINQLN